MNEGINDSKTELAIKSSPPTQAPYLPKKEKSKYHLGCCILILLSGIAALAIGIAFSTFREGVATFAAYTKQVALWDKTIYPHFTDPIVIKAGSDTADMRELKREFAAENPLPFSDLPSYIPIRYTGNFPRPIDRRSFRLQVGPATYVFSPDEIPWHRQDSFNLEVEYPYCRGYSNCSTNSVEYYYRCKNCKKLCTDRDGILLDGVCQEGMKNVTKICLLVGSHGNSLILEGSRSLGTAGEIQIPLNQLPEGMLNGHGCFGGWEYDYGYSEGMVAVDIRHSQDPFFSGDGFEDATPPHPSPFFTSISPYVISSGVLIVIISVIWMVKCFGK